MGKAAVKDLIDQYQKAFKMLVAEMERFDDHQWVTGIDNFQVPAKLTMHILDCLDYYSDTIRTLYLRSPAYDAPSR